MYLFACLLCLPIHHTHQSDGRQGSNLLSQIESHFWFAVNILNLNRLCFAYNATITPREPKFAAGIEPTPFLFKRICNLLLKTTLNCETLEERSRIELDTQGFAVPCLTVRPTLQKIRRTQHPLRDHYRDSPNTYLNYANRQRWCPWPMVPDDGFEPPTFSV